MLTHDCWFGCMCNNVVRFPFPVNLLPSLLRFLGRVGLQGPTLHDFVIIRYHLMIIYLYISWFPVFRSALKIIIDYFGPVLLHYFSSTFQRIYNVFLLQ